MIAIKMQKKIIQQQNIAPKIRDINIIPNTQQITHNKIGITNQNIIIPQHKSMQQTIMGIIMKMAGPDIKQIKVSMHPIINIPIQRVAINK